MYYNEQESEIMYILIGFITNYAAQKIYTLFTDTVNEKKKVSEVHQLLYRIEIDSRIRLIENTIFRTTETLSSARLSLSGIQEEIKEVKQSEMKNALIIIDRDSYLAELYDKEEYLKETLDDLIEFKETKQIELEELQERQDTLHDMYELEQGLCPQTKFEEQITKYKQKISKLNKIITFKETRIQNLLNEYN